MSISTKQKRHDEYEIPWRPVFELSISKVWLASSVVTLGMGLATELPIMATIIASAISLALSGGYYAIARPRLQNFKRLSSDEGDVTFLDF